MKKRLVSLILVVTMMLSVNTVALASPGGGVQGDPVITAITIELHETCNDQDQDNIQAQYDC
jgi:hypothetical protein